MTRRKHSEKALDERLDEDAQEVEPQGILEIFPRDEDAPLARDQHDDDEQ